MSQLINTSTIDDFAFIVCKFIFIPLSYFFLIMVLVLYLIFGVIPLVSYLKDRILMGPFWILTDRILTDRILMDWPPYILSSRFDPDRFSEARSKGRPTIAFSPFGFAGRRQCPAYRFAYVEASVFLVTALQKVSKEIILVLLFIAFFVQH